MFAFIVPHSQQLQHSHRLRYVKAADEITRVPEERIYLDSGSELLFMKQRRAADAEHNDLTVSVEAPTQDDVGEWYRVIDFATIARREGFPLRLGRHSLGIIAPATEHQHNDEAPLRDQAQALRQRHPDKQHFRLALMNGFGANLGDTQLGITAFRHVLSVLQSVLPSVSVTVFQSWQASTGTQWLLENEPWVDEVHFGSIDLAHFTRFDGYFDTTGLIDLPRYRELPIVDFILWWFGLDPEAIAAEEKRNHLVLPPSASHRIGQALQQARQQCQEPVERVVLFAYQASVALRSIPEADAVRLAKELLEADTSLALVTAGSIDLSHPRLWSLTDVVNGPIAFMALVAAVDEVISVDSFAQHLADACEHPTLLLPTTLGASHFPYYPRMQTLLLPGAQQLAGWGLAKLNEPAWQECEAHYVDAWREVTGPVIARELRKAVEKSSTVKTGQERLMYRETPPQPELIAASPFQASLTLTRARETEWQRYQQRLAELAEALLKPGANAIQVGAWTGALTLALAQHVGSQGAVYAIEPRRIAHQVLCANVAREQAFQVRVEGRLPNAEGTVQRIVELDPYSESHPNAFGNTRSQVSVEGIRLDDLALPMCQLITIQPPLSVEAVLAGASTLLREQRPVILMAPYPLEHLKAAAQRLNHADYTLWAEQRISPEEFLVVAIPSERKANMQGFQKINVNP